MTVARLPHLFLSTGVFLLAILCGGNIVSPQPIFWLAVLGGFSVLVIFANPVVGFYLLLMGVFLLDWLSETFVLIPRQVTWIKDIVILILLGRSGYRLIAKRTWQKTPVDLLMVGLVAVMILSSFANHVSGVGLITGLRRPLRYPLLFYALVNLFPDTQRYRRFLDAVMAAALLQFPVMVLEVFLWRFLPEALMVRRGMGISDAATGTLPAGSTGVVSIFLLGMACLAMGRGIFPPRKGNRPVLHMLLLLLPLIFTISFASFYYLLAVVGFLIVTGSGVGLGGRLKVVTATCLVLALSGYAIPRLWRVLGEEADVFQFLGQTRQKVEVHSTFEQGKIFTIHYVVETLVREDQLLFGVGAGNWSYSSFAGHRGSYYEESELSENATQGNQVAATIAELGVTGFAIYLAIIFRLYFAASALLKRTSDGNWRAIAFGFKGMAFLYSTSSLYILSWYNDALSFTFWVCAAGICIAAKVPGRRLCIPHKSWRAF